MKTEEPLLKTEELVKAKSPIKEEPFTFTPSDTSKIEDLQNEEKIDTSSIKQSWGFLGKLKKFFLGNTAQPKNYDEEDEGYESFLQYLGTTKIKLMTI